jgi:(S)-ureidoglycine aminohydrolase
MGYYTPAGGLPGQTQLLTDRAIVKEAYTVIPKGVMRDIVTSNLPGFSKTRSWIIARPIAGFATTFSQLIVEIQPGGGAERSLSRSRGTVMCWGLAVTPSLLRVSPGR